GGDIAQSAAITAKDLAARATGAIVLTGATNHVTGKFAASGVGVTFNDDVTFSLGSVLGGAGTCFITDTTGVGGGSGNVTLCSGGDLNVDAVITTTATARLSAGGLVTQSAAITASNLGVSAATGITLDTVVNAVSNVFAAANSTMGSIKFRDSAAALKIGSVLQSTCFASDVRGVTTPDDVTLCNTTGNLQIGNGVTGEVITASASGTVRLEATAGAVTQDAKGIISAANLG